MKAKLQPRIFSAKKEILEDVVPLETPISAHIDVCSVCNFRCSFCFQADKAGMKAVGLKTGYMELHLFKKIVNDLKKFKSKLKKVKIGNHGEPTLHPLLPKFIEYVRKQEVAEIMEVFTNGSKLNPDLNIAMVNAGLQRINISLEGLNAERYLKVAGVKINMEEMVKNITHLYENKKQLQIYIKIVDQTSSLKKNDDGIHVMSKAERDLFFKTYGDICDEIYIEKIVPQWAATQEEEQNAIQRTGMYDQVIDSYKKVCPFTFMYLHFNWDGTTSPCTLDWPRKVTIGDVTKESAHDIWNGQKLRDLQVAQLEGDRDKINFCNDCSAPMVCCTENFDSNMDKILEKLDPKSEGINPWIEKNKL